MGTRMCQLSVLLLFVVVAACDVLSIDRFQSVGLVATTSTQQSGSWDYFDGSDIEGDERDVSIQIVSGPYGGHASAGVGQSGLFAVSTDVEVEANYMLQYDGADHSMAQSTVWLEDLTAGGIGNAFHVLAEYSGSASMTLVVYIAGQETACTAELPMELDGNEYVVPFRLFSAKNGDLCDLTRVSCVELTGTVMGNSELHITGFGIVWLEVPVPLVLDDFEDSDSVLDCNGASVLTQVTPGINVIGSERDIILDVTHGTGASVEVLGGTLDIHCEENVVGTATVQYDGPDGTAQLSPRGLGSLDFTQEFGNGFIIELTSNAITVLVVNVADTNGASASYAAAALSSLSETQVLVPFSSFQPAGLDFTKVGSVELSVQLQENSHVTVSSFGLSRLAVAVSSSATPTPVATQSPTCSRSPTRSRTASRTAHPTLSPHVTPTSRPSTTPRDPVHPVVIDYFTATTASGSLFLTESAPPAQSQGSITLAANVLGSERDIEIVVNSGDALSTVQYGEQNNFYIVVPDSVSGTATLQYDGPDLSNTLSRYGLNGADLTVGSGTYFTFLCESTGETNVVVDVFDMDGSTCSFEDPIHNRSGAYYIPFAAFNGYCNWSSIGAVQLTFALKGGISLVVSDISTANV